MVNKKVRPSTLVGLNRAGMYKEVFAKKGFTKGCEVGVRQGSNALAMLQAIPDLKLILVDPYIAYEYRQPRTRNRWKWHQPTMDRLRFKALRRFAKSNVIWLMTTSWEAARSVKDESLDFVYIDGNHSFDFITQDLQLWYPKVRKGGIISGHDYGISSVRAAVNAFQKYHKLEISVTDQDFEPRKTKIVISWMMEKR